jgi:hypothetical protein
LIKYKLWSSSVCCPDVLRCIILIIPSTQLPSINMFRSYFWVIIRWNKRLNISYLNCVTHKLNLGPLFITVIQLDMQHTVKQWNVQMYNSGI